MHLYNCQEFGQFLNRCSQKAITQRGISANLDIGRKLILKTILKSVNHEKIKNTNKKHAEAVIAPELT